VLLLPQSRCRRRNQCGTPNRVSARGKGQRRELRSLLQGTEQSVRSNVAEGKLQIILNQNGAFVCPAGNSAPLLAKRTPAKPPKEPPRTHAERFALVVADLHKRGNARPGTVDKLLNTIKTKLAQLGEPPAEADALLGELREKCYVTVHETKVGYALPPKDV
jgi:hypothetical protein